MRNNLIVKASLFTLILAFMAIGTFAIAKEVMKKDQVTTSPKVVLTDEEWYFNGAEDPENNDLDDPSQYSKLNEETCDNEVETVCKITAPADTANTSQPDLDHIVPGAPGPNARVKDRIAAALNSGMPNETVQAFRSE